MVFEVGDSGFQPCNVIVEHAERQVAAVAKPPAPDAGFVAMILRQHTTQRITATHRVLAYVAQDAHSVVIAFIFAGAVDRLRKLYQVKPSALLEKACTNSCRLQHDQIDDADQHVMALTFAW